MILSHQSIVLQPGQMPKTLVLVPDLNLPGGVSNYYKTLELDTNSSITYFTINKAQPQSAVATALRLISNYCKFFIKLIKDGYEVVVLNPSLDEGKSFHRELLFILITHFLNKKTVVFFRGWFDPYEVRIKNSRFKSFLFRISYARATKYLVLGNIFKKKLLSLGVPAETEFFIETTVADSSYVEELHLNSKFLSYEQEVKFLFLSRIEIEKGILIAIDAFKSFCDRFPQRKSSLTIAGDGRDLNIVKSYVEERNVGNVQFVGHVSDEKKKKVLLDCHVMIFPSFTEGLPNVILEGMLYGMPIISRATGGIPEVIENGINGYITESFDSTVFTEFLVNVATNGTLFKQMAEANNRIALQRFTSEKVKERIIRIYEDCKS